MENPDLRKNIISIGLKSGDEMNTNVVVRQLEQ